MLPPTGSGKSYTMMGVGGDDHLKGIIPRLCDTLFAKIAEVRHVPLNMYHSYVLLR